jgi:hypothetical protein
MNMNTAIFKKASLCMAFVTAATVSMAGCAMDGTRQGKDEPTNASPPDSAKYLPFRIAIGLDGKPVFLDENGEELKQEKVTFPLSTSKLYSLQTITLGFVEGSCKIIIPVDTYTAYSITYPSAWCQALGIPETP